MVATTPLADIPAALSVDKTGEVVHDTPEELVVTFQLVQRSVRLMQCKDMDVTDDTSYNRSSRAQTSQQNMSAQLCEAPMTPEVTQYMMGQLWTNCLIKGDFNDLEYLKELQDDSGTSRRAHQDIEAFSKLRMAPIYQQIYPRGFFGAHP